MGKPSAPVSVDGALQWQSQLYGLSMQDYLHGSNNSYTAGSELPMTDSYEKGNPFFTQTNQPTMGKMQSNSIQRPFLWQGNNKSLRKVNQVAYDSYWNGATNPSTSSTQQATWQGPQIRATYQGQSNGLSQLGTPSYWQDNNKNHIFDLSTDDSFQADPNQSIATSQVDSMPSQSSADVGSTPSTASAPASGGGGGLSSHITDLIARMYGNMQA